MARTSAAQALPRQPFTLDWRLAAACRHTDPDLFFLEPSTERSDQQAARAKAVCACRVPNEAVGS
jgi:Transcription factor WhiB